MKRKRGKSGAPDPIDTYVGSRVRGRRIGLGLSQTKLGRAIGVTFQQVQKYENGTNRIGASSLFRIARALGVDVAFFFDGMPEAAAGTKGTKGRKARGLSEPPAASFEGDPMSSREAIELVHNYFRVLDPDVRKQLHHFVKALSLTAKG